MEEGVDSILYPEETSEVRFAINTYNDIFSDFDPRPLDQRGFSDDFLFEAKRAAIVKEPEKINFIFVIPKKERNLKEEAKIDSRLKEYFRKHFNLIQEEKKKTIKRGAIFSVFGMVLMFLATFLFFKFKNESLLASFFTILLEPASWFLFWEGLDLIIFESKKVNHNLEFHEKMAKARISFVSA
jgi:hypothetical protein